MNRSVRTVPFAALTRAESHKQAVDAKTSILRITLTQTNRCTSAITVASVLFAWGCSTAVWAETLAELPQHTHYHGIAFNRSGTSVLLLATHHGLFAVDKDGVATRVSPIQDFMGFSPDPANPLSYYASGHPATGGNSGILRSVDGGATWIQLSEGVDGPADFHQMDVSPVDPKVIYGSYGKVQVSQDGGSTWNIVGEPPRSLIAFAASSLDARHLYAATEQGLHLSEDSGATWRVIAFEGQVVSMVETGPGDMIYAFVLGRGLVKADEKNLDKWTVLSNDFGESVPLHFTVNEKDIQHLALTTHKSEALESRDGGATWHPFGSGQQ
jgi:photosystem II stability/assembly factor-like uncharacterized protein